MKSAKETTARGNKHFYNRFFFLSKLISIAFLQTSNIHTSLSRKVHISFIFSSQAFHCSSRMNTCMCVDELHYNHRSNTQNFCFCLKHASRWHRRSKSLQSRGLRSSFKSCTCTVNCCVTKAIIHPHMLS